MIHDKSADGIDRRGFLRCMAWAGTGVSWSIGAGVLSSRVFGQHANGRNGDWSFAQISDSHIGFNKAANPDVTATLQATVDRINALPCAPEFIIHTGDLSHLSKEAEYDTMDQVLQGCRQKQIFYVPGEHDTAVDDGKRYLERYGKGTKGRGWYSFDHKGVHFVGLVNAAALEGLGKLGEDQLKWLEADLEGRSSSTPIVVFAHIPLWSVYPDWGWGTADGAQALGYLKRFGSVTVLNGHIHQVMQKVEGNVTFHSSMSTAFPQPAPGSAPSPGPMKVPAEKLRSVLGLANVQYVAGKNTLAVVDAPLADGKELFAKRCGGCHSLDRDNEGPRLRGVYGRPAGSVRSFQYSDALKKARLNWDADSLDRWLADPDKLVPGADMAFQVPSAEERREIIAFLRSLSGK